MNPFQLCLMIAWGLFCVGVFGLLVRRNLFQLILSLWIMFNGTCIAWLGSHYFYHDPTGQLWGLMFLLIMGFQFLLGLGILVRSLRAYGTLDVTKQTYLKQ